MSIIQEFGVGLIVTCLIIWGLIAFTYWKAGPLEGDGDGEVSKIVRWVFVIGMLLITVGCIPCHVHVHDGTAGIHCER